MTPTRIAAAAHEVIARRDAARPVPRLPPDLRPAVPRRATPSRPRRCACAGPPRPRWRAGRSAAHTAVMQEIMGIDAPAYGTVLAGNVRSSPARVSRDATTGPLAECEIAVEIARDRTGPYRRPRPGERRAPCGGLHGRHRARGVSLSRARADDGRRVHRRRFLPARRGAGPQDRRLAGHRPGGRARQHRHRRPGPRRGPGAPRSWATP